METTIEQVHNLLEEHKEKLAKEIRSGLHKQFVFNKEFERVECRCGANAVWWKTGFLCSTFTAYGCKFSRKGL